MLLTIDQQGNEVFFKGVLNRDTVLDYIPFGLKTDTSAPLIFDLGTLTNVDSAGLAWILQQLALGKNDGRIIKLRNIPPQLLSLAKVSAVEALLPVISKGT